MGQTIKALVSGGTGCGKTFFGLTFPKVGYVGTEPNGLDTIKVNPELQKNLVVGKEFVPSPMYEIKKCFEDMGAYIEELFERNVKGEVETVVLDNMTYLAENRWIYLNEHEVVRTKLGAKDTLAMYGALNSWLYKFTLMQLCSFPGNVVVTCHEQKDDENDLDKVVDPTVPITPAVLGGFRYKIGGMFSANLSLEKKAVGGGKYIYQARCQKGGQRNAKNRYGLPEIVENVSYQRIMEEIAKANK